MALYKMDGANNRIRELSGSRSGVHSRGVIGFGDYPFKLDISFSEHKSYAQVIGNPGDLPLDQQRGAFRTLVRNNVHGIATALYKMLQSNPDKVKQAWQSMGGEYNTLMHDIVAGEAKPVLNISDVANMPLSLSGRKMGFAYPSGAPPAIPIIYYYADTYGDPAGRAVTDPTTLSIARIYAAAYPVGQDGNGYYSWYSPSGGWWSGPDADSEFRSAYNNGFMQNGVGSQSAGAPFKGPLPRGPQRTANAGTTALINAGAAALNTIIPGAGTAAAGIANSLIQNGVPGNIPVDTSPQYTPPPPPVISVFPVVPVMLGLGAAGLLTLFFVLKD